MLIISHFSVFASPREKKVLNNLLKEPGRAYSVSSSKKRMPLGTMRFSAFGTMRMTT